jgi:DNA-directed RNA polymerase specialized sigma54-like protein
MADDEREELSQEPAMTPQLRMAIKLLSMTQDEVFAMIADWREKHPGALADLDLGEPQPISSDEQKLADEAGIPPWTFPIDAPPLPEARPRPDVWVFGNPPYARANPAASPMIKAVFDDEAMSRSAADVREASWLARAVRQRASMQEKIVEALLRLCPQMASALEPDKLDRVSVREVANDVGMHESTIEKVASVCRYQTLHGVVQLVAVKNKIAHRALW